MENKLAKVTSFVIKHTDEQCGLDVADFSVFSHFGAITIMVTAKKFNDRPEDKKCIRKASSMRGMKSEWKAQAEDLIEELNRDPNAGYGGLGIEFEIWTLSNRHFELREKEV